MSSTLTDGSLCFVSANRDVGLGAATPATSPPTIAPATSTAPTETHQRMAALPSFHEDGDTQNAPRKAEPRNCRSRSQQSPCPGDTGSACADLAPLHLCCRDLGGPTPS